MAKTKAVGQLKIERKESSVFQNSEKVFHFYLAYENKAATCNKKKGFSTGHVTPKLFTVSKVISFHSSLISH